MPARDVPLPRDAEVAVVGAGPVGLTLAGRLAQQGVRTVLLEQRREAVDEGSRAICMQRETLEIWERLGIGQAVADRGVRWHTGRTYFRDRELFSVELPGAGGEHFPPFVNISQSEVEALLRGGLAGAPDLDLRWGHRLSGVAQDDDGVTLRCETDAGEATLRVAYLVGADGAHSSVRHLLGMGFPGHSHPDLFLICDIRAQLPFPNERRFFFDPPWNPGRQVLVHPQPDDVWRIDWQVPPGTDAEAERAGGGLDRRIRAVIGVDTPYQLVWLTAYRFHQRLVERFRVGRVLLAGDAAHLMSPFGARGLNSGAADAENLAWKLAAVLAGRAPEALLESYHLERRAAACENLAVTDATMRFMVPHGPLRRAARNAILAGSLRSTRLRRLVNSGRLAEPFGYGASPIVAPPARGTGLAAHGAVAPDLAVAPLDGAGPPARRLRDVLGRGFVALLVQPGAPDAAAHAAIVATRLAWPAPMRVVAIGPDRPLRDVTVLRAADPAALAPYVATGPRAWLVRPDGHLAASVALDRPVALGELPALLALALGARAAVGRTAGTPATVAAARRA